MSEECWWFKKGVISAGPISYENLQDLALNERISPQTMVRCGKEGVWTSASEFEDLFAVPPAPAIPATAEVINVEIKDGQLSFHCPHCGQHYKANFSLINTTAECQVCKGIIKIPNISIPKPPTQHPQQQPPSPQQQPLSPSVPSSMAGTEIVGGDLVCPHCWQHFSKAHLLYISVHHELIGDPVVGDDVQKRFLPTVYNAKGLPLDSRGMVCTDMACPRCHLRIPTTVVDMPSIYFSIVGAPGSGKSYLLTAMTHRLKDSLAPLFNLSFSDADPLINSVLNSYERLLFLSTDHDSLAILPKTQQIGSEFSSAVLLDGMPIDLPKPYVYTLSPMPSYQGKLVDEANRNVVLYDNAGEHFQPGNDVVGNPATTHLVHSDGIIFLFDPTLDAKMRQQCDNSDPQVASTAKVNDQAVLMAEMIARIRRHGNMKSNETSRIPLVVQVVKYDTWRTQFDYDLDTVPYLKDDKESFSSMLDMDSVMNISFHTRQLLLKTVPRVVTSAEAFFETVVYLPVSVFGRVAQKNEGGAIGICPKDVSPIWLDTPMLYLLHHLEFLSAARRNPQAPPMPHCRIVHNVIQFEMPDNGGRVQLPLIYAGTTIEIKGQQYSLPQRPPGSEKSGGHGHKSNHGTFWE